MNKQLLAVTALALGIIASSSVMAAEKTLTLAVKNIDCVACPSIVKGSLEAVPGVAMVAVSFKDKTATVIYDDAKADVNQLTSATTKAGYPSAPAFELEISHERLSHYRSCGFGFICNCVTKLCCGR